MKTILLVSMVLITVLICSCTPAPKAAESGALPGESPAVVAEVAAAESSTVTIKNFVFEPAELTVAAGTAVIWKNNDNVAHLLVSTGLFESKALNSGDEFTFTFNTPGEYDYYCNIHPSMKGKVIVK